MSNVFSLGRKPSPPPRLDVKAQRDAVLMHTREQIAPLQARMQQQKNEAMIRTLARELRQKGDDTGA